ncbi:MAG TPA: 50S ribosomal protein L30 [Armatimonadetes bacterium]|nr:50S ribosomal protein L30 [Armatimonadota bacterium]
MAGRLRIKLVRSPIGRARDQKDTVRRLGLRKLGKVVEHEDNPCIRGMVNKVRHLVMVGEVEEEQE